MSVAIPGANRAAKLAAAKRALDALNAVAGLPRCSHYKWRLDPAGIQRWDRMLAKRRGRVPPCLCAAADDPHPDCPHVTWQVCAVLELPDGTVVVDAEDASVPEIRAARRRLTAAEHDEAVVVELARENKRAARAALRGPRP